MKRTLWALTLIASALLSLLGTTGTAQAAVPYNLRVVHSGKCLDVRGASLADGALVQQWTCVSPKKANQLWAIEPTGDGQTWYIKPQHAHNKCLDVRDHSNDNGGLVQQMTCTTFDNQRWLLFSDDGWHTMEIMSWWSGLCLDVRAPATENGTLVQQWDCHGGNNQRWFQD